jgi:hypothetical protein
MRKWWIAILVVILLFFAFVYLFIPKTIVISKSAVAISNQTAAFRFLSDSSNWQKWWPGKTIAKENSSTLEFSGYNFKLENIGYNAIRIGLEKNQHADTSVLHLVPISADSIQLVWDATLNTGNNPFFRIGQYFKAKKLTNNLDVILEALQSFISDRKNIYDFDIKEEKVKVEYLVSTTKVFPHYPETASVYEMIGSIKDYINQSKTAEDGYPMLNIKKLDSNSYEAQVGIPVSRELPSSAPFFSKRMLKNGDILAAEVKGGKNVCDSAIKKVEQFVTDHRYLNVALPFQSLITDRSKEKDSNNWITKIYYPIVK